MLTDPSFFGWKKSFCLHLPFHFRFQVLDSFSHSRPKGILTGPILGFPRLNALPLLVPNGGVRQNAPIGCRLALNFPLLLAGEEASVDVTTLHAACHRVTSRPLRTGTCAMEIGSWRHYASFTKKENC
jgi:hypothetical protein